MASLHVAISSILVPCLLAAQGNADAGLARLDSAIAIHAKEGFSGVVLIARRDSVLFEKAYGAASRLGVAPAELAFWLASDSKQVTATAVMRLEERGRLRLTDSVGRFFDGASADKRAITIHQLLTHTSGLPHEYAADGIQELDRAIEATWRLKLKSAPGARYSYSNDGYTLLAAIVQKASGVPFDDYVRDSLFTPAGLTHTGLWGHENRATTIAPLADERQGRRQRPTIFANMQSVANWGYRGPTGVFSSARDMQKWIELVRSGKLLRPESVRTLLGRHVSVREDSTGQSYTAYGWGTRVEGGKDVSYGHSGNESWLGHNAILRFTPGGDIVVVLSNSGDIDGSGWSSRVNRTIRSVFDAGR